MLHVTTSVVNWKSDGYLWRSISSRNVVQQWWLRIVVNPIASPSMIQWRSAECPSAFLPRIFGKISGGSLYWLVNRDFPTMGSENPLFCWIAKSSKRFWSSNRGLGHTARLLSNCRTVFVCDINMLYYINNWSVYTWKNVYPCCLTRILMYWS